MIRKFVLFIGLLFCITTTHAAETCDAGQYLNGGTCTACPVGTYKDTTGPQECTPCPPANATTVRTTFPDAYYPYDPVTDTYVRIIDPSFVWALFPNWLSQGNHTIDQCSVLSIYQNVAGRFNVEVEGYNPETGRYDVGGVNILYYKANPGYYLDTRIRDLYCKQVPNNHQPYSKAIKCPAGYYCPGGSTPICSGAPYETEWGRTECPEGHYCPTGAAAPTACPVGTYRSATGGKSIDDCVLCPAGTSTRTDANSSASDCLPLCEGGITKLHAGQNVFTLWKDKHTSPSIHIRAPGGDVCYVNLTPGAATKAININYNDQVYHTVD